MPDALTISCLTCVPDRQGAFRHRPSAMWVGGELFTSTLNFWATIEFGVIQTLLAQKT